MQSKRSRASGSLRVEDRKAGRVWVAKYRLADGTESRKVLGPAWVRDSGQTTARGAVKWRAAAGTCPDGYLTPGAAQEALEQLLAAAPKVRVSAQGVTWGEAADAFISYAETVGWKRGPVSVGTARGYRSIVNVIEPVLRREDGLSRLRSHQLERMQEAWLREGVARQTVRHRMRLIATVLDFAVHRKWLGSSPMDEVRIIPQPKAALDFRMLEPSQVEAVARAVADVAEDEIPMYRSRAGVEPAQVADRELAIMRERRALYAEAVRFAAYTGLRAGELRALRWRDVDFPGAIVHVRRNAPTSIPGMETKAPKSEAARSVPLIDPAAAALDRISRHLADHDLPDGPEDLVFPTRDLGMLDAGRLRDAFYRGLAAAELGHMRDEPNPMTWHDLRHTFASIAVRVFPVSDVQAFMGHSEIATTMRYVHHVPRTDAAARLSQAFAVDLNPEAETARA